MRQAIAPISLSGLAVRAASTCLSRLRTCRLLMAFQLHPSQRHERRRAGALSVIHACRRRLVGEPHGAAQPTPQSRDHREMTKARGPAALRSWRGRGGYPGFEDAGRFVQAAGPKLDGPAGGQHLGANPRVPGEPATGDPAY